MVKTLGCLVPISANTLTGELNLILIFLYNLTEAKVGNFDLAIMKDNILWLKIVVDYLLLLISQVLEA